MICDPLQSKPYSSLRGLVDRHRVQALGPVAAAELDVYQCCTELYGSTRMLLACLQPHELEQVQCAVHATVGAVLHEYSRSCFDTDYAPSLEMHTLRLLPTECI